MTYADGRVESGNWYYNNFQPTEQQRAQQEAQKAREAQEAREAYNKEVREAQEAREAQKAREARETQEAWEAVHKAREAQEAREKAAQKVRLEREAREAQEAREAGEKVWQKYAARPKTVLEQVLNYTTTGDENGGFFVFPQIWVSGKDGTHKCVMTEYYMFGYDRTVDLRQINPDGFRIKTGNRDGSGVWSVGDENIQIPRDPKPVMERLQKAWGLALAECPPAVRKPF
jgi:hypothetical protein